MEPENETGNVEYKLKLLEKDNKRIETLATQMRYRRIEKIREEACSDNQQCS